MIRRKRVTIAFIVNEIYLFQGSCSAEVSLDRNGEIMDETICDYIEDLEDVEFIEVLADKYNPSLIPNEGEITESDIERVYNIINVIN